MVYDEFAADSEGEPQEESRHQSQDESVAVDAALNLLDPGYSVLYSPLGDVYIYTVSGSLVFIAIIGGLILLASPDSGDRALTAIVAMLWLLRWVLVGIALAGCAYPAYHAWRAAKSLPAGGKFRYLFTKDGINVEGPKGSSLIPWSGISRVVETRKGFFLYCGVRIAALLPNRSFPSNSEIAIVRKFIRKYIANAVLLG